jgi:bacteriocin resistance YdeI/OmpD-like protein/uncharacterized protein DUF1905
MSKHRFKAIVELTGKTATFMEVPLDIPALFDGAKKPPVRVKIKDHVYRSTIAVYGGRYYLPINRDVKRATGVTAGDEITVEIERDAAKRVVDVPPDLKRALKTDKAAGASFEGMSYSHQKQYVDWIEEAKRAETRERRIAKTVHRLHASHTQS